MVRNHPLGRQQCPAEAWIAPSRQGGDSREFISTFGVTDLTSRVLSAGYEELVEKRDTARLNYCRGSGVIHYSPEHWRHRSRPIGKT